MQLCGKILSQNHWQSEPQGFGYRHVKHLQTFATATHAAQSDRNFCLGSYRHTTSLRWHSCVTHIVSGERLIIKAASGAEGRRYSEAVTRGKIA